MVNELEDKSIISTKYLASKVHLSSSRLRHIFKGETGISLHKFIIWARMKSSINDLIDGKNITQTGIKGGFIDSSHYHKTMSKQYGVTPSEFIRSNKRIEVFAVGDDPMDVVTFYDDDEKSVIRLNDIQEWVDRLQEQ